MKKGIRLALSLCVSAVLLWLAFRNVDLVALKGHLTQVDGMYVVFYVGTLIVIQACRVFRWDILIRPFAQLTTKQLLRVSNVGLMLILVLPLRLGELGRPYLLKQETGARMSAGLGAVAVERAIDGLLVTLLFFVTTTGLAAPYEVPAALRGAAFLSLGIFSTATVVIVGALATGDAVPALLRKLGTPISAGLTERAVGMLEAFISGLEALPNARSVAVFVGYTLIYWAANGLGLYFAMLAFGWDLPPIAGFVLVCIIVLGIMIPAGPGHLGTFQAAILMGLGIFQVEATEAAAYGLVIYPVNVIVLVGFGLPYLFGRRADVQSIMRASSEAAEST